MEKPYNSLSVGQYVINRRRKPVVMVKLHNKLPVGQHYSILQEIPFVNFNSVLDNQSAVFILETFTFMMFPLILNVFNY